MIPITSVDFQDTRSFGILSSVELWFRTDVSGQPIGPIFSSQGVQEFWIWNCCPETSVRNSTLRKIPKECRSRLQLCESKSSLIAWVLLLFALRQDRCSILEPEIGKSLFVWVPFHKEIYFCFLQRVQPGYGAQPSSYSIPARGSVVRGKAGREWSCEWQSLGNYFCLNHQRFLWQVTVILQVGVRVPGSCPRAHKQGETFVGSHVPSPYLRPYRLNVKNLGRTAQILSALELCLNE
jgi:hypothetical protein